MYRNGTRVLGRALVVAIATAVAGVAQAQSINIGTGRSGGGVLADGAVDPNWLIAVAGGGFNSAVVLFPNDQCCGMNTVNTATAKWIGSATSATPPAVPSGWNNTPNTVVRRTFDLTGYDLSTVGIVGGIWRVADGLPGVRLNGNLLFSSPAVDGGGNQVVANWSADNPFAVAVGSPFFVAGVNTLDFEAETLNGVFDGLYVDATVTGQLTAAPEPSSVVLVTTGFLALAGIAARRRRG